MSGVIKQNWAYYLILAVFVALVVLEHFIFQQPRTRVGDVIEHISALNAWIDKPFNPDNPGLKSDAASPRFIPVYFPFVLLGAVLNWDGWLAFNVITLFGALLFVFCAHKFFNTVSLNKHAALLGWLVFMGIWANPWNYSSVYAFSTLYKITGYPSIIAFSLSLLILSILIKSTRSGELSQLGWIALAVLTAIVMATHVLTGVFLLGAAALYILFSENRKNTLRLKLIFAGLGGVLLSLLWPFYSLLDVIFSGRVTNGNIWISDLSYQADRSGWLIKSHAFYEFGRFYPILLGLICAALLARKGQIIPLLGILGFSTLYVANLFMPIPLGHRYIIYALFFGHLAILLLVLRFLGSSKYTSKVKYGVLAAAIAGFFITNYVRIKPNFGPAKSAIMERNLAVQSLTDETSVIAGDARAIWMLTAYDRKVLWLKHPNPLVKNRYDRAVASVVLQSENAPDPIRKLAQDCFGVTHLLLHVGVRKRVNKEALALSQKLSEEGLKRHRLKRGYVLHELSKPQTKSCDIDDFTMLKQSMNEIYPDG